ncbi:hypothetical protein ACM44_06085 [Chryseobacterium koreense CCUG 49689]|uniref:Uncharacterized protein n=1 Tax=Chryseobacterium koreense CCUG 49689 TaxID=1304281 RepID=A0A0J7J0I2_9FLAO|nr:hypothetical protein ACM44_06085 [Chryseobacterium koreense CCUG 49689]
MIYFSKVTNIDFFWLGGNCALHDFWQRSAGILRKEGWFSIVQDVFGNMRNPGQAIVTEILFVFWHGELLGKNKKIAVDSAVPKIFGLDVAWRNFSGWPQKKFHEEDDRV